MQLSRCGGAVLGTWHPHCVLLLLWRLCQAPEWLHGSVVEQPQPPPWCHLSAVQDSDPSLARTERLTAKPWCLLLLLWVQAVTAYFA